jgi:hypothetical protein
MRRMKRKYKVFIAIGVLLNVVLCLGLYVNYKLDSLVAGLNAPGILFQDVASSTTGNITRENPNGNSSSGKTNSGASSAGTAVSQGSSAITGQTDINGGVAKPGNNEIADSVLSKVNKPVEKTDLIKAGMIIMRKLNSQEISFLYRVGNSKKQTHDDLVRTREILLNKLSPEDIGVLRELGKKYGKDLRILDPNVPIK